MMIGIEPQVRRLLEIHPAPWRWANNAATTRVPAIYDATGREVLSAAYVAWPILEIIWIVAKDARGCPDAPARAASPPPSTREAGR